MNKAKANFFLVNRELLHSDRWLSEPFTRGQAWIDLFGLAQHTDGFFRIRGIKIDVKRGQLAYSQITLAKRWKWSRNKVKRYLEELENQNDISLKTIQQNGQQIKFLTTLITIVNYDKWQGYDTAEQTAERQQKDTKRYIYNNDNNENNDNNIVEQSSTPFSFKEKLDKIWEGNRKDLKIIARYFSLKGFSYDNELQYQSALKRELKPAKMLLGYTAQQIDTAVEYCKKNYPDIWTLETLHKVIDKTK